MMQLTIIGFGNQARSWAMNLRDSGFPVRIALRPGSSSLSSVRNERLSVVEIGSEDFYRSEALALLIPDHEQNSFLTQHAENFKTNAVILYAHGYAVSRKSSGKKISSLATRSLCPEIDRL